jgi:predicted nucleic acid-binding protein
MVIDTMIFAYALLYVPEFRDESLAVLDAATDILVPDSFRAELVNVVWQWVRYRSLPLQVGLDVLREADALITQATSAAILWERALTLAAEANHPAYDTLFVALAESTDTKVVTYDIKLQASFPDIAISPAEFLA